MIRLLAVYTGTELETLTDEQVEKLINYECAEAGVPFAPEAPTPFVAAKPDNDVTLFQIGTLPIHTKDRATAEEVADFLAKHEFWTNGYDWKYGYENNFAQPVDRQFNIAKVETFSESKIAARKDQLAADKGLKERAQAEGKAYGEAMGRRSRISESVWGQVHNARQFDYERKRLIGQLDKCVELADGNAEIGLRFFTKANGGYEKYFTASVNSEGLLLIVHKHYINPENVESETAVAL